MLSEHDAKKIIQNAGISMGIDDPRSCVEVALTLMETGSPRITQAAGSCAVRAQAIQERAADVPADAVQDAIIYFSNR